MRQHGIAASYSFCHEGENGACDACKAAHADRIAAQRFRRRRRRIKARRADATLGVASTGIWQDDRAPAVQDSDEKFRDSAWQNVLTLFGYLNENGHARWLSDDNGRDVQVMAKLCEDFVTANPEQADNFRWQVSEDGLTLTLSDS
jgi:hypothetical protein